MNRIASAFEKNGKKTLIAFLTGGDPSIEITKELIIQMADAGVDMIEIGVPFSDPAAEGPIIERANIRGIASKTTVNHLFEMVKELRQTIQIPILFVTYANLIFAYGKERFMKNCAQSGVDGFIVPDLPLEENDEFREVGRTYGIAQISMISPTSTERISMIVDEAEGFLYCVLSPKTTGCAAVETMLGELIEKVDEKLPCVVGVGISSPDEVREWSKLASGLVIESAVVALVEAYGEQAINPVGEWLRAVRKQLDLCEEGEQ